MKSTVNERENCIQKSNYEQAFDIAWDGLARRIWQAGALIRVLNDRSLNSEEFPRGDLQCFLEVCAKHFDQKTQDFLDEIESAFMAQSREIKLLKAKMPN